MSDVSEMMKEQGYNPVEDSKPAENTPTSPSESSQGTISPEVVQTPTQDQGVVQQPENATKQETAFDWSKYGVSNEEELKTFIEKGRTYEQSVSDYKSKLQDYESKSAYYNELEGSVKTIVENLTGWMANDQFKTAYAVDQIAGANKSKSAAVRVLSSDLEKMNDLDVLVLQDEFNVPSSAGKTDLIKSAILEDIGVNVKDIEEEKGRRFNINEDLTPEQRFKLERKAAEARGRFSDLKATVKYPELPDPLKQVSENAKQKEERAAMIKTSWGIEGQRISQSKSLDTLEYYTENEKGEKVVDFSYKIDPTFKSKIPEMVVQYATSKNMDYTQENVDKITKMLVDVYEIENRDLIRKAYAKEKTSALERKYDDEKHNPRPFNTTENPNPITDPQKGLEDWVSKKLLGE